MVIEILELNMITLVSKSLPTPQAQTTSLYALPFCYSRHMAADLIGACSEVVSCFVAWKPTYDPNATGCWCNKFPNSSEQH